MAGAKVSVHSVQQQPQSYRNNCNPAAKNSSVLQKSNECVVFFVQRQHTVQLFLFTSVRSGFKMSGNKQLQDVKLILIPITKSPGSDYLEIYNQLHPPNKWNGL